MKVPIVATANTAPADHQLIQFPKMTEVPIPISKVTIAAMISIKISSYLYFIICLNYSFAEFLCGVPIPHVVPDIG